MVGRVRFERTTIALKVLEENITDCFYLTNLFVILLLLPVLIRIVPYGVTQKLPQVFLVLFRKLTN